MTLLNHLPTKLLNVKLETKARKKLQMTSTAFGEITLKNIATM